jgi:hypothetical protein
MIIQKWDARLGYMSLRICGPLQPSQIISAGINSRAMDKGITSNCNYALKIGTICLIDNAKHVNGVLAIQKHKISDE